MRKLNCWELKKCGRESHGAHVDALGVCPAYLDTSASGVNGGLNGGRICWAIAGTLCGGQVQGSNAQKEVTCITCDVFRLVDKEEGTKMALYKPGQVPKPRAKSHD